MPTFKEKLANPGRRLSLHVCTIPSAAVTQAFAASGADGVIIDLEHGAVDYASAHAMIAATAGTDCCPLVRIAKNDDAHVKRAMDLGAEGIVFPLIRTAEDAAWAVSSLRYPPNGTRSFGPFLAHSRWHTDMMSYARTFGARVICVLLAETVEAIENIDEICAVSGIDMIVPAPFDLSTALGRPGEFDHPNFISAVTKIETAAKAANIPLCGNALTQEQASALFDRGYRGIGGFDALWLRSVAAQSLGWCAPSASS